MEVRYFELQIWPQIPRTTRPFSGYGLLGPKPRVNTHFEPLFYDFHFWILSVSHPWKPYKNNVCESSWRHINHVFHAWKPYKNNVYGRLERCQKGLNMSENRVSDNQYTINQLWRFDGVLIGIERTVRYWEVLYSIRFVRFSSPICISMSLWLIFFLSHIK